MPRCSVLICKNDSRTVNVSNGGVSYHRFPKDPHIKERWIDSTGRNNWFPKLSNTICSDHFDPKDILLTKKGYKYITDTAVPTRNFLSYHARVDHVTNRSPLNNPRKRKLDKTPTTEANSKSKSDEVEVDLPLAHVKVEATPGPSRKRANDSSTETSSAKVQKETDSDSDNSDDDEDSYQNLTQEEKELDSMLRYEQNKIKKQAIKMKRLQNKLKRLKMTISDMEDLYSVLEEKFKIPCEDIMSLKTIEVTVSELVARRQTNKELSEVVSKLTYSPDLRSFALTLHFISVKAYDYVRKTFKTSLPHPRTLKHWYLKVDGEPGFTKEAFVALKRKADASNQPILATLIVGEMNVTRCVEVDGKIYGYVDMGTGLDSDMLDEARQVLVLSVVAINGHFKVPVACFLACNVTSEQRAELVKIGIELAHDAGIKVVALSFADIPTNVFMANHLGCNFNKGRVTFNHPVNGEPIVAILDPSNMLQCLRDILRDMQTLIDKDGCEIQWKYLQQLRETKYLSKQLQNTYTDFKNARVQVKLETELFSPRIAEALQYCRKDLELEAFKDSEPTQKFVMLYNTIYDVFYSINSHVYGFKNAFDKDNADEIFEFLNMAADYISKLKMKGRASHIMPRCLERSHIFVTGIKQLYTSLIETNILDSLPLYKLSHDHLRRFFWNMKVDARCKIDKDPTPKKCIHAYKKIVALIKASKGKNPSLEQISMPLSLSPVDRMNRTAGQYLIKEDNIKNDSDFEDTLELLSHNNEVAVVQASVYIIQQLIKKINCDVCVQALVTKKRAINDSIVAIDKGCFLYPSRDVIKVCKTTEMFLRGFDGKSTRKRVKTEIIMAKIMHHFVDTKIFNEIWYHQFQEFPESNHVADLMKAIIERYARMHYRLRKKRETYKDVLALLKEKWSKPPERYSDAAILAIFS